jgi:hypothetical protein
VEEKQPPKKKKKKKTPNGEADDHNNDREDDEEEEEKEKDVKMREPGDDSPSPSSSSLSPSPSTAVGGNSAGPAPKSARDKKEAERPTRDGAEEEEALQDLLSFSRAESDFRLRRIPPRVWDALRGRVCSALALRLLALSQQEGNGRKKGPFEKETLLSQKQRQLLAQQEERRRQEKSRRLLRLGESLFASGQFLRALQNFLLAGAERTSFFSSWWGSTPALALESDSSSSSSSSPSSSSSSSSSSVVPSLSTLRPEIAPQGSVGEGVYSKGVLWKVIKCLRALRANVQAAVLCQLIPEEAQQGHFATAFQILQSDVPALDGRYFQFIWELPLLEMLVFVYNKRKEDQKVNELLQLISKPALNINNDPQIRARTIACMKTNFFKALYQDFVLHPLS